MSEYSKIESLFVEVTIMDGPLENLWGGGGAKYKKNIRAREN